VSYRNLGQDAPLGPAAAGATPWAMMIGWGSVVAVAAGIFYFTVKGGTPVRANRRKRRTSRRRTSVRRNRKPTAADIEKWRSEVRGMKGDAGKAMTAIINRDARRLREALIAYLPKGLSNQMKRDGASFFDDAGSMLAVRMRIKDLKAQAQSLSRHIEDVLLAARKAQYAGERRTTRRRRTRRNSRRRTTRNPKIVGGVRAYAAANPPRYKALSAAARKRMPASYFALPGKRYPFRGAVGSSRARDKVQARRAIQYLQMGRIKGRADYLAVRNAIIGRYGNVFWRASEGPSWPKVEKAIRRRRRARTTRGERRRKERYVAAYRFPKRKRAVANRRRRVSRNALPAWMNKTIYWGRHGNGYYVEAPNRKIRLYRGFGAKAQASDVASSLAARYGLPKRRRNHRDWGLPKRGRPRKRVSRNAMNKVIWWGRRGRDYYAQDRDGIVKIYQGQGAKARALKRGTALAQRHGMQLRRGDNRPVLTPAEARRSWYGY